MSLPIFLRPEAQADLLVTRDWYDRQRPGLGGQFAEAVERLFDRIEAMPELYAVVLQSVRRGKLQKFPYLIYYRVLTDRIEVIAALHSSRDPERLQERI